MSDSYLLIFGLGYCGGAIGAVAAARGWAVGGTTRDTARPVPDNVARVDFGEALGHATHLLVTAAPDAAGDPVLAGFAAEIGRAKRLRWIGYLSTTGVYGDQAGGWVTEASAPSPGSDRTRRRVAAEQAWAGLVGNRAVDIFRLAGIYGPGRSAFDDLRAGTARRVIKPGHAFGRIHRDDIAAAVLAAMGQGRGAGSRVLNLADDLPAESADVVAEAARLLGVPVPEGVAFDDAVKTMSPMARGFWAENRKVSSAHTKAMLGLEWRYPTYREGLRAILSEESAKCVA